MGSVFRPKPKDLTNPGGKPPAPSGLRFVLVHKHKARLAERSVNQIKSSESYFGEIRSENADISNVKSC